MSRFYFNTREGSKFMPDDEGLDFPSLDIAEREAAICAAAMGKDTLPKGDCREITIEVCNEHRQRLSMVRVTMDIDRVVPSPASHKLPSNPYWRQR